MTWINQMPLSRKFPTQIQNIAVKLVLESYQTEKSHPYARKNIQEIKSIKLHTNKLFHTTVYCSKSRDIFLKIWQARQTL